MAEITNASALMAEDLAKSELEPRDIKARVLDNAEKAATLVPHSVNGYVIPYFDLQGKPLQHYRVRLFEHDPKYKQVKDKPNHVYFPPNFWQVASKSDYIILTEGEKKAALATKRGFPACALGGVDSWRNRILTLPKDVSLDTDKGGKVKAKLPSGAEAEEDAYAPLAIGLQELVDHLIASRKHLIIIYDMDTTPQKRTNVQRAAASLAFDLRFRGVAFDRIRQIDLPADQSLIDVQGKIALDDYLVAVPDAEFATLIKDCMSKRSAFPRHPAIRDFLNKKLQRSKLSRRDLQSIAMAILSELDATGLRLRNRQEIQSYYFDYPTHRLIRTNFAADPEQTSASAFGQYLYRRFGIASADNRLYAWIGAQFTGEEPIEDVSPYRVFARVRTDIDSVTYQLSDAQYVVVDKDGIKIKDNGADGVLFEADQVKPLDTKLLIEAFEELSKAPIECWWADTLTQVRLRDKDKQRLVTALLFYINPWLLRWRNTQLPVELVLGEAGSGKSTLCELRLDILTGEPKLRNSPQDIKDWHAQVTNSGGIHVTDNVQLADKALRQRLSDELCRIVTEPNPSVEMRKYYTNSDLMRIPIKCAFGITAIKQPFQNADILQRSVVIELDKAQDLDAGGQMSYDSDWKNQQLRRHGGREYWVAHHLDVLRRFFALVPKEWQHRYAARHRLINFEQIMLLMAKVFGLDGSWIPDYLSKVTDREVTAADWAFEGIQTFAQEWYNGYRDRPFCATDLSEWAELNDDYKKCEALISSRSLGRYLKTHKSMIASMCGIYEASVRGNKQYYKVVQVKR